MRMILARLTIFCGVFPSAISCCSCSRAFRSSTNRDSSCSIREMNHDHTRDSNVRDRTLDSRKRKEPPMVLPHFVKVLIVRLRMIGEGLAALYQVPVAVLSAQGSGLREKIATALFDPYIQRLGFRFSRAFLPNIRLPWTFITSYPSRGTALVTRRDDVIEVLDRNADFEVVYEPRMRAITGGENFFLGMQDSALYTRDVSNMRLAVRRDDVALIIEPPARRLAERLVAGKAGRIDIPPELSLPVPTALVTDYLGVTGAPDEDLQNWATLMVRYLFADLQGDPELRLLLRH